MPKLKFKSLLYCLSFVLSLLSSTIVTAQDASASKSIFDVMNYREVLSVTLEANFTEIDSTRRSAESRKAVLTFEDENGKSQQWDVKLTTRGNYRRMRCEMSPLKVNFKKKELKAAGLAKFDDMKLVTHCVSSKLEAKKLLAKEYLAYKLYNELTEFSFRVQLLKIIYKDTGTGDKIKSWAFLIEDTAEMKNRVGATATVENHLNLSRDTFHDGLLKVASVYQYMIGNSDWSIGVGRNVKYIIKDGKVLPIPYDFDFSGFVNAAYAVPNPNYRIESVRTRIYLGFSEDAKNLTSTLAYFKTKRLDLLKIVEHFKVLNEDHREGLINYLNSFYATMNDIILGEKIDTATTSPIVSSEKE